jgi:hypothetical protein
MTNGYKRPSRPSSYPAKFIDFLIFLSCHVCVYQRANSGAGIDVRSNFVILKTKLPPKQEGLINRQAPETPTMTMIRFLSATLVVLLALSFPLTQASLDTSSRVLQPGGGATTSAPVAAGGGGKATNAPAAAGGGAVTPAPVPAGGAVTSSPAGATSDAPSQTPAAGSPTSKYTPSPAAGPPSPTSAALPTNEGPVSFPTPQVPTSGVTKNGSGLVVLGSVASLLLVL